MPGHVGLPWFFQGEAADRLSTGLPLRSTYPSGGVPPHTTDPVSARNFASSALSRGAANEVPKLPGTSPGPEASSLISPELRWAVTSGSASALALTTKSHRAGANGNGNPFRIRLAGSYALAGSTLGSTYFTPLPAAPTGMIFSAAPDVPGWISWSLKLVQAASAWIADNGRSRTLKLLTLIVL